MDDLDSLKTLTWPEVEWDPQDKPIAIVDGELHAIARMKSRLEGTAAYVVGVNDKWFAKLCGHLRVQTLHFYEMRVSDLEPLVQLSALRRLALRWNTKLTSIVPVRSLQSLQILVLEDTPKVRDLSPVAKLHQLRSLEFSGGIWNKNIAVSLEPVAALSALQELVLHNLWVESGGLRPIAQCKSLRPLYLTWLYGGGNYSRSRKHQAEPPSPHSGERAAINKSSTMLINMTYNHGLPERSRSMTEVDLKLACAMTQASALTYSIGEPGGIQSSPFYAGFEFVDEPTVFEAGTQDVDACFVGKTNDAVVLGFRGTIPLTFDSFEEFLQSLRDWINDADVDQIALDGVPGKVHHGFARSLESLWSDLSAAVSDLTGDGTQLYVTGHSKGGALAPLAAIRLQNVLRIRPAAVFDFAGPRIGDQAFVDSYDRAIPNTWRFAKRNDIVPHLPPDRDLLDAFRKLPGSNFRDIGDLADYEHLDTLQFIEWNGRIVGNSKKLERRRAFRLFAALVTLQFKEIVDDHDITGDYMKDICDKV